MFDFSALLAASNLSPASAALVLLTGTSIATWLTWAIITSMTVIMIQDRWLNWRATKWWLGQEFILLAVDIPREHEQTPKAVEQMFAQIWAAYRSLNLIEVWWHGMFQLPFSFEIVSIGGYVQFLIHTPAVFRDLIEAGIYAQYPAADIVEVEDYVHNIPQEWPAEGWGLWGTEFEMVRDEVYPIKTYPHFEHQMSQKFADPLAALLEIMSTCSAEEQIWLQWVITPVPDTTWVHRAADEVKRLIGKPVDDRGKVAKAFGPAGKAGSVAGDIIGRGLGVPQDTMDAKASGESLDVTMFKLTPGETDVVKGVQMKATKVAYRTKARMIYVGRSERFMKTRGVSGTVGGIRQFSELSMNAFKPNSLTMTAVNYFFVKTRLKLRQNKILKAYALRHQKRGNGVGFIFNIEELASVWHFPNQEVEAPRVKKAEAKKAEPPVALPVEGLPVTQAPTPTPEPALSRPEPEDIAVPVTVEPSNGAADEAREVPVTTQADEAAEGPPSNLPV